MRRYGIARYLTQEQRERAARAPYTLVDVPNWCEDQVCQSSGEYIPALRVMTPRPTGADRCRCPLGVALGFDDTPDPAGVEMHLAPSGHNRRIYAAARRFIHDVDSGKIGPDDIAVALGVEPAP